METQAVSKPGFWQACILASRPKTLTAAVIPIVLGTVLAQANGADISFKLLIFALLSALSTQIGVNMINDALDFCKGADTNERLGPDRVTQKGWLSVQQVMALGFFSLLLGLMFGIPLFLHGGFPVMGILIVCAAMAYFYTGGPFPLAYLGLGELFVMLFFGIVATVLPYYLQTLRVDAQSLLAGFEIGCAITIILLVNNLRDIHSDAKAKKRTTAVRFGKQFARIELTLFALVPYAANFVWLFFGKPFAALLPLFALPLALLIVKKIWIVEPSRTYNQFLGMASLHVCAFGLFLSLGFLL